MKKIIFIFMFMCCVAFSSKTYAVQVISDDGCIQPTHIGSIICCECFTQPVTNIKSCDAVDYSSPCPVCYNVTTGGTHDILQYMDEFGVLQIININKDWSSTWIVYDGRNALELDYTVYTGP